MTNTHSDWIFPLPNSLLWNTHCEIYCSMASDSSCRTQLRIFILSLSPAFSVYVAHSHLILPCLGLIWRPEHFKVQSPLYLLFPSNWTLIRCPLLALLISAYSLKQFRWSYCGSLSPERPICVPQASQMMLSAYWPHHTGSGCFRNLAQDDALCYSCLCHICGCHTHFLAQSCVASQQVCWIIQRGPSGKLPSPRSDRLLSCAAEILRAALPKRGFMAAEDFALLLSRWLAGRVTARAGGWESRALTPGTRWFSPFLFDLHDFLFVRLFCFCITVCTMHLLGFKDLLSLCHQWLQ